MYTAVCIWAGGRSQEEVLAELILVLEFPACESSAAVLVVLTDLVENPNTYSSTKFSSASFQYNRAGIEI